MIDKPGIKALLGYDIVEGVSVEDYERWLADVHFPDLLANPYLDRIVTNDTIGPVTTSSAGSAIMDEPTTFYRVVEMHFADREAYDQYIAWFEEHPIDPSRGPAGRTKFHFYLLADSAVTDRDHSYQPPL